MAVLYPQCFVGGMFFLSPAPGHVCSRHGNPCVGCRHALPPVVFHAPAVEPGSAGTSSQVIDIPNSGHTVGIQQ
jgi:acyl dehydratase